MGGTPATTTPAAITPPPENQGSGGFDHDDSGESGFAAAFADRHGLPDNGEAGRVVGKPFIKDWGVKEQIISAPERR